MGLREEERAFGGGTAHRQAVERRPLGAGTTLATHQPMDCNNPGAGRVGSNGCWAAGWRPRYWGSSPKNFSSSGAIRLSISTVILSTPGRWPRG